MEELVSPVDVWDDSIGVTLKNMSLWTKMYGELSDQNTLVEVLNKNKAVSSDVE